MPLTTLLRLAVAAVLLAASPAFAQSPADRLNARSVFQRDSTGTLVPDSSRTPRAVAPDVPGRASLVARYRAAHEQRVIERALAQYGGMLRPVEPPPLPVSDPEVRAWQAEAAFQPLPIVVDSLPPLFEVRSVEYVPPQGRLAFRNTYRHTRWSYVGTSYRTGLDTTQTWRLRSALEARFGPPTQTLADLGADVRLGPGTSFMFEYWFVVNDSIPVLVTDPGSPTDRGLVMGVDGEQRLDATVLRDLLFAALANGPHRPYIDYLYDPEARTWQVVGFDGVRLVRRDIPRPDFRLNGRPRLEQLAGPPARR